jgi:acyl-coenzyme A synthetase/AMP-(fatty) acid ligase
MAEYNLYKKIIKNIKSNVNKTAIINDCGDKISYNDMKNSVENLSYNLLNNIKYKNPKLLILLDNSEFLVYLLLACSKLHILNSPINASLKIDQIYKICELIKFTHIITAKKNYLTSRIKNNLNIRIIFIEDLLSENKLFKQNQKNYYKLKDDFIITFSSGSTGSPKPILLTQKIKIKRAQHAIEIYKIKKKDIIICPSPIHHSLGQRLVFVSLLNFSTLVLMKNFNPIRWENNVYKYKVTIAIMISSQISLIVKKLINSNKFSSIRCLIASSSSINSITKEKIINKYKNIFHEMYGTAELSTVSHLKPSQSVYKKKSVGKICSNAKVVILDKKFNKVSNYKIGQIACYTPLLFKKYFYNDKLTSKSFFKGFFLTGDLGFIDDDNYLFFSSREKDVIITSGVNIYPSDIETEILKNKFVKECMVIGINDKYFGEAILAVCLINNLNNSEKIKNALKKNILKNLASFQQPLDYKFIDKFQYLPSGKINKIFYKDYYNSLNLDLSYKLRSLMGIKI